MNSIDSIMGMIRTEAAEMGAEERLERQRRVKAHLAQLGELIRTQDNRITSDPIFLVQEEREFVGEDGAPFVYWDFVAACFTEKAAEVFIARQRHNLHNPRIYVASGCHNEEWKLIRGYLKTLAPSAAKGEGATPPAPAEGEP